MPWYAQLQIFKNWRYVTLEINPSIMMGKVGNFGGFLGVLPFPQYRIINHFHFIFNIPNSRGELDKTVR